METVKATVTEKATVMVVLLGFESDESSIQY
jgi:hypothetical protein